jgi:hypothetical protein
MILEINATKFDFQSRFGTLNVFMKDMLHYLRLYGPYLLLRPIFTKKNRSIDRVTLTTPFCVIKEAYRATDCLLQMLCDGIQSRIQPVSRRGTDYQCSTEICWN